MEKRVDKRVEKEVGKKKLKREIALRRKENANAKVKISRVQRCIEMAER